jgi:hypothetical protein
LGSRILADFLRCIHIGLASYPPSPLQSRWDATKQAGSRFFRRQSKRLDVGLFETGSFRHDRAQSEISASRNIKNGSFGGGAVGAFCVLQAFIQYRIARLAESRKRSLRRKSKRSVQPWRLSEFCNNASPTIDFYLHL